jgi:hypothetical protein
MIQLSERTRRGLAEAFGIPGVIGGLVLALLVLSRVFGAAA